MYEVLGATWKAEPQTSKSGILVFAGCLTTYKSLPRRHCIPMSFDTLFSLQVKSFRAFRDEAAFNIRPLTLLYGFNQAGKSTLLRLLALLADSMQKGAGPLDLQSPSLRGSTFKELGWMGREPALTPWLEITAPSSPNNSVFKLQFDYDNGLIVNRLHLSHGPSGDKFKVDIAGDVVRDADTFDATYAGRYRGTDWEGRLAFRSLFPEGLPEQAEQLAQSVHEALQPLHRMQWLHANRLAKGFNSERRLLCCRANGADLSVLLPAQGGQVLDSASAWLRSQDGMGSGIVLRKGATGRIEFMHEAAGREQLPLHMAGEGLRALLPILLCACWAETKAQAAPTMLAVEEPEAHLHPTLQVGLFDRLIETVSAGIPVVLETHSVYLLRALQLAVLDGRLKPEQVGLHWFEQDAKSGAGVTQIEIGSDATLKGWRPDVFEKEQELAHEILDQRWQKGGDA